MNLKPIEDVTGRIALKKIKQRFVYLAKQRFALTQESLPHRQKVFLDLLPLLFHINHPLLPGYISSDVPAGIPEYTPERSVLQQAKTFSRSFTFKRQAFRQYPIYSLFLMGSGGTVAYSKQSDFDLWLCYDPKVSKTAVNDLAKKCSAVEQWAASLGLEIYIYLINPSRFKQGENLTLSAESSGNAQHHLLLEEFYRTGLWLAGRVPIWWYVPPAQDHAYQHYVDMLNQKKFINPHEVFDLGGMDQIDAKEFFGSALWQLYKGIDAPYKSMLKIMLMEVYAAEYPKPDWLSHRLKHAVYYGDLNDQMEVDPYISMYRKLEQYFSEHQEIARLNLLRESFYFKTGQALTKTLKLSPSTIETLRMLVKQWGWDKSKLQILDQRSHWKIDTVILERKRLSAEFSKSYRKLVRFAQTQGDEELMNSADLHILGRKLYAAMDKRPGKIEIINLGISKDMAEPALKVQQTKGAGQILWSLFSTHSPKPLHQTRHLVELLIWGHTNGLINQQTKFSLQFLKTSVAMDEFQAILSSIQKTFDPNAHQPNLKDFAVPARLSSSLLFINVGIDPFAELTRKGLHLLSDRTDALCYGANSANLGLTFDWAIINSWKEIFVRRYDNPHGLLTCLCDYLNFSIQTAQPLPTIQCYSFSSLRGSSIAQRIEQLFSHVRNAFCDNHTVWYLLSIEKYTYVIMKTKQNYRFQLALDEQELFSLLGEERASFTTVIVDPQALLNTPLKFIYPYNKAKVVQMFYAVRELVVDVYFLDEYGSFFHQNLSFQGELRLLNQFDRFLQAVEERKQLIFHQNTTRCRTEYYVIHQKKGHIKIEQKKASARSNDPFFEVKVMAEQVHTGKIDYTILCNEQEFSSMNYGDQIFDHVVSYILKCRHNGETYPIYVTDIDVSPELLSTNQAQTISYLQYKKKIERKLNLSIQVKQSR